MVRLFLLRYFETYFRHRWLYLLPIFILVGAGLAYFYTLNATYSTRGILYVNNPSLLTSLTAIQNNDTNWWITPAQAFTNELNELLQTDAFVRAVIQETDLEENMDDGAVRVKEIIDGVRRAIRVSPAGSNQIFINATTEFPQISYQLVPAVINSYIFWQINTELQDSLVAQEFFQELTNQYASELEFAREALTNYYDLHPAPLELTERLEVEHLQNQINLAASRYNSALDKKENANLAMAQVESDIRQTYVLVDAPQIPDKSDLSSRKMAIQIAAFIGVGVALSLISIAGATVLDRSFRFPIDVENHLQLPVLAVTPDVSPRRKWYHRLVPGFLRRKKESKEAKVKEGLEPDYFQKEINQEVARVSSKLENKNISY